jgi:Tol biopolymer transport system component
MTARTQSAARIAFASKRDGHWEIYVMDADGRNQRRLTRRNGMVRFPLWSPDRSRLAFASESASGAELWVMNADGTGQRRIAPRLIAKSTRAWLPDGRRISFTAVMNGDTVVAVADVVDGTIVKLATGRDPSLSPDGSQIAFSSARDGNRDIYLMNVDGSGVRRITRNAAADETPSWSPDGSLIAFVSQKDLYVVGIDGREPRRLTRAGNVTRDQARWSPDGTRLAIQLARGTNYDIAIAAVADGRLVEVAASPDYDGSFTWSPDGSSLAFISGRAGAEAVFAVPATGGPVRRLTNSAALTPAWR